MEKNILSELRSDMIQSVVQVLTLSSIFCLVSTGM